jgi:dCTP deaminase
MMSGSFLTDTDLRGILCAEATCTSVDALQLYPFSEESMTPAGYDLRVGKLYTSTKKAKTLEVKEGEEIIVPPGDTCLVTTMEYVGMPKNRSLSGLIVSTVTMVARGLSHVSTSVDADWSGQLMIVVHNHAFSDVRLIVGERLCTLVFFSNRTPSTKTCGVFDKRDDIFRNKLLESSKRSLRKRRFLDLLFVLIIPFFLILGYTLFGNKPGLVATTAAGIAISGMLFTFWKNR